MSKYDETANALEYQEYQAGIAGQQLAQPGTMNAYSISLRQKLELQLKETERKEAEIKELLNLLDKNPDIQRVLELMKMY